MRKQIEKFVSEFNTAFQEIQALSYITRCSELQEEAVVQASELLSKASELKLRAQSHNDEYSSNTMLSIECLCEALAAEMAMWLHLKNDLPAEAWDQLILAQTSTNAAIRAVYEYKSLDAGQFYLHLLDVEKHVFPPQVFLSAGYTTTDVICSLCDTHYDACDHLVGRPYLGEFCQLIIKNATIHEASIVDIPFDKRCRVTCFKGSEGARDNLTWRLDKANTPKPSDDGTSHREFEGVVLREMQNRK